jgi:hypothetical protein
MLTGRYVAQNNVSNGAAYGTMMQLEEVAFNMPVEPDVSVEVVLTHALHNTTEPPALVPIEPPHRVSPWSVPWVESLHEHLMTTSTSFGTHPDEDCTNWLSDNDVKSDNLAPQDPVSRDTVKPPVKPPVILHVTDWVAHTLLNTDWDSISPDDNEADRDPTEQEST